MGQGEDDLYVYASEVTPRLACVGGVVGVITFKTAVPQVVRTSGGRMPMPSWALWGRMGLTIIPKSGGLKAAQYVVMREMKLNMDLVMPAGLSTALSFGIMGTFFQSIIYNTLISDMYKLHTGTAKPFTIQDMLRSIRPGFVWCFGRECFSMGGGLWLGPIVKRHIHDDLAVRGFEVPDYPLRFSAGFLSGAVTAFGTQFMHNTTLLAGRMAAVGEARGAPFYTLASFLATKEELGFRMIYANLPQRILLIAGAVGLLNMVDIFHRSDVVLTRLLLAQGLLRAS